MRGLPFFKPKNKPQFAGMNFSDASGGGGSSPTISFETRTFTGEVETVAGNSQYKFTLDVSNSDKNILCIKDLYLLEGYSDTYTQNCGIGGFYFEGSTLNVMCKNYYSTGGQFRIKATVVYY